MQKFYNTELPRNLSGGSDTWDQPQASVLLAEIFDRGVVKSSTFNYNLVNPVINSSLFTYSIPYEAPAASVNLRFLDLPSYSQSSCPTLDFTNPLANGLQAFFSVKDNIDLVNGIMSTISTETIPGNGIAGNFSGTSQQKFPHNPKYAITGPITVVALVDNRALTSDSILISKQDHISFRYPYEICLGSAPTNSFGSFSRAGAASKMTLVGTVDAIPANSSNNVIIFTDSSSTVIAAAPRQMYVNGKNYPITTYQNGSSTAEANTDNGADVIIGRKFNGNKQLDGNVYYVALWNRVLTASEIKDITENPWGLLQGSQVVITKAISGGSSVLSNLTELYNIRAFIQGDRSSAYNIRSAINASLVESFNIRANALSSLAESYNIRSFTVSDKAGTYNVRALIQKDNASTYYVNTFVNSSASQVYNIRDLVQKSLAETYNIRDLSLSDLTENYFVKSLVQQSLVEAYNIRDLVNSSLSSTYDILSTLAFVISDKSALYNIQESINSSKACTYNIRVDINSSLAENYLVNSFVVSSNNSLYNIRSSEQASISLAYNIRSGTFSSLSANYDILNAAQVSSNFIVNYLIRSATVKDTTLSYYIRTATVSDEGCTYSIRVNLTKDSFFDFNILSVINASTAQQYNVRNKVQSDKTLEYFILALQAVYKDINVLYNILQDVVPDAIIIYVKDNSSIDITVQSSTGLDILTSTNQLNVVVYTKNS